jgi:hypothetical protein
MGVPPTSSAMLTGIGAIAASVAAVAAGSAEHHRDVGLRPARGRSGGGDEHGQERGRTPKRGTGRTLPVTVGSAL